MNRRELVAQAQVSTYAHDRPIEVLALTKYDRLAASSRCRFYNYVPLLAKRDVSVTVDPFLSDSYVRRRLAGSSLDYLDLARSHVTRLGTFAKAPRFDVLWIEGEFLPRWPAIVEKLLSLLGKPYVVDLDDAIFHTYDRHPSGIVRALLGNKIDAVFKHSTAVVVGNEYLAERARLAGASRVVIVPTTVDHSSYAKQKRSSHDELTIGWIGSAATAQYLQTIASELEQLCSSHSARLVLIGIDQHDLALPDVTLRAWSEATEIVELAACDIGLAPMAEGYWERGKCGLKAIQYMAMGIPVLAADVGVLPTIVRHGETGFVYRNGAEFSHYARLLADDPDLRKRMGTAGRQRVAQCYATQSWVDTIADVLIEAALQVKPRA